MAWAIVIGGLAAGLLRGVPFDESVANGLVSTVNPLVVARRSCASCDFRPSLARLRNVVVLIAACAVATPIGATLGTATILAFRDDSASAWVTWLTWWTGDFAGVLLVAPILFEVVNRTVLRRRAARHVVAASAVSRDRDGVGRRAGGVHAGASRSPSSSCPVLLWAGCEASSTDRRDRQRRDRRHREHRHRRRARTVRRVEPH